MGTVETINTSLTSSPHLPNNRNRDGFIAQHHDESFLCSLSDTLRALNQSPSASDPDTESPSPQIMRKQESAIELLREGDSLANACHEELLEEVQLEFTTPMGRDGSHAKSLIELSDEILAKTQPLLREVKAEQAELAERMSGFYSKRTSNSPNLSVSDRDGETSIPHTPSHSTPRTPTKKGYSFQEFPAPTGSPLPSPSAKSIRSLSALSPNKSLLQRAWSDTFSRIGRRVKSKKSLKFGNTPPGTPNAGDRLNNNNNKPAASTPIFPRSSKSSLNSQNKLDLRSDWSLLEPIHPVHGGPVVQKVSFIPRSNSAGEAVPSREDSYHKLAPLNKLVSTGDIEDEDYLNTSQRLTHQATTDLKSLEAQDKLKSTSEAGFYCQLQEDESGNVMEEKCIPSTHLAPPITLPSNYLTLGRVQKSSAGAQLPQGYYTLDSRRVGSKHFKNSMRDKSLLYGVKQFNCEPKRGITYLLNAGFLDHNDAKSVAKFLFREGRLSKRMIGRYIGGHDEFNREVLHQFVRCHEFTHLNPVQALRQFLWSFRLPGEAMQIDRLMEAFADRYCEQNPKLFQNVDTCYILSFSIIMLNTALHNPNVKPKITIEQFIKQNRGIDSGKDLAPDVLEMIYRSIKEEPFKIPDETYDDLMYTFFSPEKEGWLMKQGGSWKSWKRRWFVLSDRCLYYFQHTAENVPKGIIPLENVKVRLIENVDGKSFCFELFSECTSVVKGCKTDAKGNVVQGNHKSYRMSATSENERADWVKAIQRSAIKNDFEFTITGKKEALRRMKQNPLSLPNTPQKPKNASSSYADSSTPRMILNTSGTPIRESQAI